MSWADIQRAIFGNTPGSVDDFRRTAREAVGVPRRNWTTAIDSATADPNSLTPAMPRPARPTPQPTPNPMLGTVATGGTGPWGIGAPPPGSWQRPAWADAATGDPNAMTPAFAPEFTANPMPPMPPMRPRPISDMSGEGNVPEAARIASGPAPMPAPAPGIPVPPVREAAPAPARGWEGYTYTDDLGRTVYNTRNIGEDHPAGMPWADPNSGFQWKGLLG